MLNMNVLISFPIMDDAGTKEKKNCPAASALNLYLIQEVLRSKSIAYIRTTLTFLLQIPSSLLSIFSVTLKDGLSSPSSHH